MVYPLQRRAVCVQRTGIAISPARLYKVLPRQGRNHDCPYRRKEIGLQKGAKMRKKKPYLFRGVKVMALSIDEVLRQFGLPNNPKTRALIARVKVKEKK